MKLPDPCKTGLEHFHIGLRGDSFELVRTESVEKAIQRVAPGPERGGGGVLPLRESGHCALEGVAVTVAQPRQPERVAFGGAARGYARFDRRDQPAVQRHTDVAAPAAWQQGPIEMEGRPARHVVLPPWRRRHLRRKRAACP